TGPSILQVPRVYEDLFAECGLKFSDYVTLKQVLPNTRIKFWDGTHLDLTADLADFKRQLGELRADLPAAFDRWYADHIAKNVAGYGPYLGTPVRPVLGYLNAREIAAALPFRPWETLYQHYWRYFRDERVAYALGYQAKYLGMHPREASSIFSLVTWLEFADGIWHPEGGFRALARGLGRAAENLGVRIHLNSPVKQVLIEGGQARGVLLESGEQVRADAVVVNADFGYGMRALLPPEARGSFGEARLKRLKFSCSTFTMYLGINRRYEHLPHHQLYLSSNIRRTEKPYIDDSALDETAPSFYVCNPSIIDPGNAPDGHSTLFVLVPVPNTAHAIDWQAKKQVYRDLILSRLPTLGYDDIEQHIVSETIYTADTWRDEYNVHLGAVFNLVHGWTQLGPLRPSIRSDGAKNLYWIGGAVHPGSGLLTILEAARSAAHFIGEDVPAEVPQFAAA
ncbi:MAG: phytoene desaturase, partial [Roseiflexaceae bacterium]|nr:phytoene desaturase [Roseiflexaceae bacterium]